MLLSVFGFKEFKWLQVWLKVLLQRSFKYFQDSQDSKKKANIVSKKHGAKSKNTEDNSFPTKFLNIKNIENSQAKSIQIELLRI